MAAEEVDPRNEDYDPCSIYHYVIYVICLVFLSSTGGLLLLSHNSPRPNISSKRTPFGSRQLASIIVVWEQYPQTSSVIVMLE
jgi:hypothetical protein